MKQRSISTEKMSEYLCNLDIASMYPYSIRDYAPLYAKPEQVPWSKYKDFRYKKSLFSDEYFLFGQLKNPQFSIRPFVDKLLKFSSESALLLTCEIYGIEVKREK